MNKTETASDEDDGGNYGNNNREDGGISSSERGRYAGVGDTMSAALVIGCGDLDLSSRIASNQ